MWIRKQDMKNLFNCDYIDNLHAEGKRIYAIFPVDNSESVIGEYETEERALDVLSDMQVFMIGTHNNFVYQMPEK